MSVQKLNFKSLTQTSHFKANVEFNKKDTSSPHLAR